MTTDEMGESQMRSAGNFLSRWSRRKVEARETVAVPATVVPVPPDRADTLADAPVTGDPASAAPAAEPLPSVESLHGLEGEYSGFLKPEVDDVLRRSALKKLFADPHFNVIDVNEAYSGDWATSTPIPAAALAMMEQVKHLLVDPDSPKKETKAEDSESPSVAADSDSVEVLASPEEAIDAAQSEPVDRPTQDGAAADFGPVSRPVPQGKA